MSTPKVLFAVGLGLFLVSFFIPVNETEYGFDLALLFFGSNFKDEFMSSLLGAFMASITNIAACMMLVSWFRSTARWVSWLAFVGAGAAIYWTLEILLHHHFEPAASVCWSLGFLMMTVGFELKRRGGLRDRV